MLRPLDDRYSASRGSSQQIRGYSRQSESYVSSLSNSADNSAHDEIDDDDMGFGEGQYRYSALFPYQRPGSRAYSVPNRICLGSGRCSSISMSLPLSQSVVLATPPSFIIEILHKFACLLITILIFAYDNCIAR